MVFSLLNHGSDGLESKAQFFCLPVLAAPFLSFCSDDKMCAFLMMTSLRSAHVFLQTQSSATKKPTKPTVFENHRKSLTRDCERRELRLHFEWTCMVTLFDRKFQIFKKIAKIDSFWHFSFKM